MRVDAFDFDLPEERIALRPAIPRDSAKMMIVQPGEGIRDSVVREIPDFLSPGDALVFNDAKVIPAQLEGVRLRGEDGESVVAKASLTLHMNLGDGVWKAFARGAKKLRVDDELVFGERNGEDSLSARVEEKHQEGEITIRFDSSGSTLERKLALIGSVPLPPYIAGKRKPDKQDLDDYQTIYARRKGAVAAPTAGLHFTPELLSRLENKGVRLCFATLHVGAGTFLPVKSQDALGHEMHPEWGEVGEECSASLNAAREAGGRIVAVGTTALRLLESASDENGKIRAWKGTTDLFILPGYCFKAVDLLMTNFHLPRSTLFMLVSAFCGLETMKQAYAHAIGSDYRFYSYGDACLLYPAAS